MLPAEGCVILLAEQYTIIGTAFFDIDEYLVSLVDDAGIPMPATEVRMLFQFLHQCLIAGTDERGRRIGLYIQDAVVVSLVFHGGPDAESPAIYRHREGLT